MKKILFCSLLICLVLNLAAQNGNQPILKIEGGMVQGINSESGKVSLYKGIPYAASPVGELRWKEPQPVQPWEGIKVANKFSNAAYQGNPEEGGFYTKEFFSKDVPDYSEDCLYLNIWTPAQSDTDKKLPVAMWIHGGGFGGGNGFEKEFDGEAWAEKGVILVTINYRLGVFGFLTHPELSAESPNHVSGNYGILDQIAAIKWIQNNITQFGGDPKNITIFGQSAGALSVQALVTSPLSKDILSKAIIQSAGGVGEKVLGNYLLPEAEKKGKKLMDNAGYTDLKKMRSASGEELSKAVLNYIKETFDLFLFFPVIDNYILPETFSDAAKKGNVSNIPYMIGYVEGDKALFGGAEPIAEFCRLRERDGGLAFAYNFDRKLPGDDAGVFHSAELWYVFNTLHRCWRPFEKADYELSEKMVDMWTNFARSGNPNATGKKTWSLCTNDDPRFMIFDVEANKAIIEMREP